MRPATLLHPGHRVPFDLGTAGAVLAYVLLLSVPGVALTMVLAPGVRDPLVRLGVGAGLGLGLWPLLMLWLHVAGLHLGGAALWLLLAVCGAAIAMQIVRQAHGSRLQTRDASLLAPAVALGAVFLVVLLSRWSAASAVSVPLWGDSLHHSMITELLSRSGGLVDDWLPMAPLSTFTYHFGFHASAAGLTWLTGLRPYQAVLVAGQVLGAMQVLTAYALVAGLTGRPWAGVAAAVTVGGLSPMPAYYVNWGRYTQLAGQVLLPAAAMVSVWAARGSVVPEEATLGSAQDVAGGTSRSRQASLLLLAALALAGMVLTHYLITLMLGLFLLSWLVIDGGAWSRAGLRNRVWAMVRLGGAGLLGAVLIAPWLRRLADSVIARAATEMVTGGLADAEVYGIVPPEQIWSNLDSFVGRALLLVVAVAAVWGLARRRRVVAIGVAWVLLLLLAAYPGLVGLRMTPPLKDFTVAIGLYLPASLIVGDAIGEVAALLLGKRTAQDRRARVRWAMACAAIVAGALLAWGDRAPIDQQHVLVTPADERAMEWLRDETPPDAVFLSSCIMAFGGTVCAGDDAGWWLPVLAGRRSTVPPVTYTMEATFDPRFASRTNTLARLWQTDLDGVETRRWLDELDVTHAYVGVTARSLDRERLELSPFWRLVYDKGGVEVFERASPGSDT